ncbi:SAM-dependent methyltransferase [Candidatus Peregrinibacteria bacterium]|nr:SAM-dependent methyltransferase [Candidatus Peregrinibacteria bacterium]
MIRKESKKVIPSSFRDPNGFVFLSSGKLYRQINKVCQDDYEFLMHSGLFNDLVKENQLVPHKETTKELLSDKDGYKIIEPEKIPFISYPYEWCFSQLKDAALLVLEIQKKALKHGMSLKDASAYNVQFKESKPIFIDTLSFEKYEEGKPWVAYRQFCQHFIAPLALMRYSHISLNQLFRIYLDGVPLDIASALLPLKTHLNFSLQAHIHLHARIQKKYSATPVKIERKISKFALEALIDSLTSFINGLKFRPTGTEWAEYYDNTNYSEEGISHKKEIIEKLLTKIKPETVWDLGANTGLFSRISSKKNIRTVAFDIDQSAVEKNYLIAKADGEKFILPLVMDVTNPSPGIGWNNEERTSLFERGPTDCAFGLALIHHLAISNNTPFEKIAHFFSKTANYAIVEFIPKTDSKVQRLLATRKDIFLQYNQQCFELEFSKYFHILEHHKINKSERILYLLKKHV